MIWVLLIVHISAKLGSKEINPRELEDQFMMDEEMLPEDLPEHKRAKPQIDIENLDLSDPLSVAAETKKGQTVLVFVDVRGDTTPEERDEITLLWEGMMINAHNIEAKRFPVADNRSVKHIRIE